MPVVDYYKSKIYKIVSSQIEKVYIGSTTGSLQNRLACHRALFNKWKTTGKNYTTSYEVLKFRDAKIELVENFPCMNKRDLLRREGMLIRMTDCVNKNVAGRTAKEYYEENAEAIREKQRPKSRDYYHANKEKRKELQRPRSREYYYANRDKILVKQRVKSKEYYQANRERLTRKIDCECGGRYTLNSKSAHMKTKRQRAQEPFVPDAILRNEMDAHPESVLDTQKI